jgi:hypothetical protein
MLTRKNTYCEIFRKTRKNSRSNGNLTFCESLKRHEDVIRIEEELEKTYDNFWLNIFHNDAFVFYKNAILFYKNLQNNKAHNFFSGYINNTLIRGQCNLTDKLNGDGFLNDKILNVDLNDLCRLSLQTINILDSVFSICPRIPFNLETFRIENRPSSDEFFTLKKGDYYRSPGYMSTTINPWYADGINLINKNQKTPNIIWMIIQLPVNSMAYYMNNLKVFNQEWEILLPRENIFQIIKTKKIYNILFITMRLVNQIIPNINLIDITKKYVNTQIIPKNEYKDLDKTKYYDLNIKNPKFNDQEIKIKITKYLSLVKNNKKYEYSNFLESLELYNNKARDSIIHLMSPILNKKQKTSNILLNGYHILPRINKKYKKGEVILISYPIEFFLDIDYSIFLGRGHHNNLKSIYFTDKSYPYLIIINYKPEVEYIPIDFNRGLTLDISRITIDKVEKMNITDEIYYYLIEAS